MPVTNAQDGQVPGALPTFGGAVDDSPRGIRFRGLDGGGAAEGEKVFANLSQQLGAWEDRAAIDEGTRQGKIAGLDPNYRPDDDPSLRGQAYRNAATATYTNNLEANARTALTQAYDQYNALPADQRTPDVLAQNIAKIQNDFHANHVFPEIKGQFDNSFSALSTSFLRGAQSDQEARMRDAAKASFLVNQNSARDTGMRLASIPSTSDAAIADQVRQHDATVDAQVAQGTISAVDAVKLKDGFKQDLLTTRVRTLFDNAPSADKPAIAARFDSAYGGKLVNPDAGNAGADTGSRNNNFTNITDGGFAQAQPGYKGADGRFASFATPEAGLQAAAKNLDSYAAKGFDTVAKIINRWSPPGENDTGALISAMAGRLGVDPNAHLNLADPAVKASLIRGLIQQETGKTPFTSGQIAGALTGDKAAMQGQTYGLTPDAYASVSNYMASELRSQTSQAQHAQKAAISDIGGSLKQIEGGFDVTDADWAAKRAQYGASPDPLVSQTFQQADAVRSMYAGFKGQTPSRIEAQIASYDAQLAKGATPGQVEMRGAAQKYLDRLRNDLSSNPLGRGARDGVVPGIAPLDLSSADKFAATLQARIPASAQVSQFYGLQSPAFMTPDEKSALKSVAAEGGEHMVQIAATAAHVLGPDAGKFFAQIGGDAPSFAQMGRVAAMNGDAGLLRDASWTVHQDQSKGGKVMRPSSEMLQQHIGAVYGDAFKAIPDFSAGAKALAANALGAQIAREGFDPKTLDRNIVEQTLQKAAGATFDGNTQYGGVADYRPGWFSSQKVLAPPDVRADQLGTVVKAINDADLKALPAPPVAKDGTALTAAQLRDMKFVSLGPGVYHLAKNDPASPDPQYALNADGSKFTLNLNALAPALRARAPGAYKGQP